MVSGFSCSQAKSTPAPAQRSNLKKSLTESKVIRFYTLLWGVFILGILIALPFGETQSQWRYVALAGFLLSAGSFIFAVGTISSVQNEIRVRYPQASNGEKQFLTALFYFGRGIFLLMGILILISSSLRKDILEKDVVEINGKISTIEVYGNDSSSLKIVLANNSNEYETRTFKIPDEKLRQIENELQSGDFIFVLIARDDKNVMNDPYVQIYGVRTEAYDYLSLEEYNKTDATNNSLGRILGIFFTSLGLIYLLTGRIKTKPDKIMRIDQNVSKA